MSSDSRNPKIDFLRMALTLFAISALVAALLGLANYFTAPVIEATAEKRLNDSLRSLVASADHFDVVDETSYENNVTVNGVSVPVRAVYNAVNQKGGFEGYCIQVQPMGYSDIIDMIVAIDKEGAVSGVQILSISDTPGVGMKVDSDEEFKTSVYGLDDAAAIVKTEPMGNEVQVISGATISSSAYINGVNAALSVADSFNEEVQQ